MADLLELHSQQRFYKPDDTGEMSKDPKRTQITTKTTRCSNTLNEHRWGNQYIP